MLATVLIVILILALLGGVGPVYARGPHYGYGYGGGLGLLIIILIILALTGRL